MSSPLTLHLVHPDPEMIAAFRRRFAHLPNVHFHQCRFEDLPPHDCFVTAGNSFGIMTAGINAAVVHFFGPQIMHAVQRHILQNFLGEQPVGTAFILPTAHEKIPFLVHAPTMRVPTSIDNTTNVYIATWSALLAIHAHNQTQIQKIQTAAFPAFGTGFGQVPFDQAARQMAAACSHFIHPPEKLDWDFVIARQKAILYDGPQRVVRWG